MLHFHQPFRFYFFFFYVLIDKYIYIFLDSLQSLFLDAFPIGITVVAVIRYRLAMCQGNADVLITKIFYCNVAVAFVMIPFITATVKLLVRITTTEMIKLNETETVDLLYCFDIRHYGIDYINIGSSMFMYVLPSIIVTTLYAKIFRISSASITRIQQYSAQNLQSQNSPVPPRSRNASIFFIPNRVTPMDRGVTIANNVTENRTRGAKIWKSVITLIGFFLIAIIPACTMTIYRSFNITNRIFNISLLYLNSLMCIFHAAGEGILQTDKRRRVLVFMDRYIRTSTTNAVLRTPKMSREVRKKSARCQHGQENDNLSTLNEETSDGCGSEHQDDVFLHNDFVSAMQQKSTHHHCTFQDERRSESVVSRSRIRLEEKTKCISTNAPDDCCMTRKTCRSRNHRSLFEGNTSHFKFPVDENILYMQESNSNSDIECSSPSKFVETIEKHKEIQLNTMNLESVSEFSDMSSCSSIISPNKVSNNSCTRVSVKKSSKSLKRSVVSSKCSQSSIKEVRRSICTTKGSPNTIKQSRNSVRKASKSSNNSILSPNAFSKSNRTSFFIYKLPEKHSRRTKNVNRKCRPANLSIGGTANDLDFSYSNIQPPKSAPPRKSEPIFFSRKISSRLNGTSSLSDIQDGESLENDRAAPREIRESVRTLSILSDTM